MNSITQTLIDEIKAAPETVQREVYDFLIFLKSRKSMPGVEKECLLTLAETSWSADWNTPQEDEAWRDL
jgi:hypothetical protein